MEGCVCVLGGGGEGGIDGWKDGWMEGEDGCVVGAVRGVFLLSLLCKGNFLIKVKQVPFLAAFFDFLNGVCVWWLGSCVFLSRVLGGSSLYAKFCFFFYEGSMSPCGFCLRAVVVVVVVLRRVWIGSDRSECVCSRNEG